MFRFTNWMPAGYDWSHWLDWFRSIGVDAWVEVDAGNTAVFRGGKEAMTGETEISHERSARIKRIAGGGDDGER